MDRTSGHDDSLQGSLAAAGARLKGASRALALTGAGVSAESGVPVFRGPEGLWHSFRPEELATPEAFDRDPRLVWEAGAFVIEVNPEPTPLTPLAHVSLRGKAAELLPALEEAAA